MTICKDCHYLSLKVPTSIVHPGRGSVCVRVFNLCFASVKFVHWFCFNTQNKMCGCWVDAVRNICKNLQKICIQSCTSLMPAEVRALIDVCSLVSSVQYSYKMS